MRTQEEIDAEIKTLESYVGRIRSRDVFGGNNDEKLQASIDALKNWDDEDWLEGTYDDIDVESVAMYAQDWANELEDMSPSEGWSRLLVQP